ncbi:sensor histidine kinase, partial [Streptosporangium canum]
MTTPTRPLRSLAGLALGVPTALAELAFLLATAPLLAFPRARRHVLVAATTLADVEVRRLGLLGGAEVSGY